MFKSAVVILGLAGGAYAYYKYNQLSEEEKEELKQKAKKFGKEVKDTAIDLGETLKEEFDNITRSAKQAYKEATQ